MVTIDAQHVSAVYADLKKIARRALGSRGAQLQPTELVHEAWERLDGHTFNGPTHYRAVAALAMRQILADHARAAATHKRSGVQVTLTEIGSDARQVDLVALHLALERLEAADLRGYRVVCLRYLGGLTAQEVADQLNLSRRTVQTTWRITRAWLSGQLSET